MPPPGMEEAVRLHEAGRLAEAGDAYRAILAAHPDHADALHLLGVVALQSANPDQAIMLIGRALALAPAHPIYLGNLATAHLERQDAPTAIALYRQALAVHPGHVEARYNLGNALRQTGDYAAAAEAYRTVVARLPDHLPARNNLALCLAETGRLDEAIAILEATLAAAPGSNPTRYHLARLLQQSGRIDAALVLYDEALRRQPDDKLVLNSRGTAFFALEKTAEAERDFQAALALDPDFVEAILNLAVLRHHEGRFEIAAAACRQALALDPDSAAAHMNLGSALSGMRRHEDGLAEIGIALSLRPNHVPSWHNRGQVLNNAGRREDADQAYARALELDPGFIESRFGRAVVSLLLGRFGIGWREYRTRRSMRDIASQYHREILSADLTGRHVVVERDQGLGDELFFLRFAPALARRGARVTYLADARLVGMLTRAGIADRVLAQGEDPGPFDLHLAVGDLPYVLGMGDGDPPPPSLALAPDQSREAEIAARLAAFGPGPYLAVTWRAGTQGVIGVVSKQTPAERLARALHSTAATLVAVQRRPEPGEIETFARAAGRPVLDLSGLNDDLEDMLALMGLVDDHVCVSNTNVHLRAARGRPSRVLVPHPPEFRWMGQGDESPWFPGSRVYRQAVDGGWQATLDRLAHDLRGNEQG